MVDVAQLQSSIINREIAEQKHRPVPLLYRRFTDQFEQPTDTTLLQAMLLALTDKKEDIPNIIKSTDGSQFSKNINSLNSDNSGQAQTGQEHRHNQLKQGVMVGSADTYVGAPYTKNNLRGGIKIPETSSQKAQTVKALDDATFSAKVEASKEAKQQEYHGHLNLRGANKKAVEHKLAISDHHLTAHHEARLEEMDNQANARIDKVKTQIQNVLSDSKGNLTQPVNDAINILQEKLDEDVALTKKINRLVTKHKKAMGETMAYTNDGGQAGAIENTNSKKKKAPKKAKAKYQNRAEVSHRLSHGEM